MEDVHALDASAVRTLTFVYCDGCGEGRTVETPTPATDEVVVTAQAVVRTAGDPAVLQDVELARSSPADAAAAG